MPSGIAALLVATEPVWIAMLMPAPGASLERGVILGLAAGSIGVALLVPREAFAAGWGEGRSSCGAPARS